MRHALLGLCRHIRINTLFMEDQEIHRFSRFSHVPFVDDSPWFTRFSAKRSSFNWGYPLRNTPRNDRHLNSDPGFTNPDISEKFPFSSWNFHFDPEISSTNKTTLFVPLLFPQKWGIEHPFWFLTNSYFDAEISYKKRTISWHFHKFPIFDPEISSTNKTTLFDPVCSPESGKYLALGLIGLDTL